MITKTTKGLLCLVLLSIAFIDVKSQNTWTSIANVSSIGRSAGVAFQIGSKGYMGMGDDFSGTRYSDMWEYDIVSNAWTQKASAPQTLAFAAGFAIGSKGYVCCGSTGSSEPQTMYEFDPVANVWITRAAFPGAGRFELIGFSIGSKGYAGLGRSGCCTYMSDFYEYNPATNTWTTKTSYPVTSASAQAFAIGSNGRGYVGGGNTSSGVQTNSFYEYNPVTNAWTAKTNLPVNLVASSGTSVGGRGYFTTGFSASSLSSANYEYDPNTNAWTTRAVYGGGTRYNARGFSNNGKIYVGTGASGTALNTVYSYTPAQQLSVSALNYHYCAGTSVSVPYTSIGYAFSSNTFTVQLSDANGQWASPTTIGTATSNTASGNIACTIPAGASGAGYRIRITSSNPAVTGGDNGTSLVLGLPSGYASSQTICSGQATSVILNSNASGATYTWTAALQSGTVTGFSNQVTAVAGPIAQTLTNTTTSAGVVRYTVTPISNGCSGSAFTVDITVNPKPVLTVTPSTQNICTGNSISFALSSNIAGTTYTWTVVQASGITGGFNCTSSCGTSIAQGLSNSNATAANAVYTITPTVNGCAGNTGTATATVNRYPVGSATDQTICSGQTSSVVLNSTVAGTTYIWSMGGNSFGISGFSAQPTPVSGPIAQTLTNSGTSTGSVSYNVQPTAAGCTGSFFAVSVFVNPSATITASPTFNSICSGNLASHSLSSNVSGTSYTWTVAQGSGITGGSNCSSGCGTGLSYILSNSETVAGVATYTVTPSANGCNGNILTVTDTVKPKPTGSASAQTICSGQTTNIALSSNVAGTLYTWTTPAIQTGSVSGYSQQSTGISGPLAQTLTNTGTSVAILRYTITPTANGCSGNTFTVDVTINPRPTGSASNQTICSGQTTNVALSSNLGSTTYTWTAALQSGTVTGFSNQATASNGPIAQTLTNATTSTGVVRYTVTPTTSGCSGNTFTVDVTVNPIPTGSASNQTICSGQATSVTLNSTVIGTNYTWTAALQSGTVTGFSNQPTAVAGPIAQTLTNNTTSAGVIRYTITSIANGCTGNTFTSDVTVNPKPTGSASAQTICSGQTSSVALNSNISGTTFTWTAALQSGTATGFSNQPTAVAGPIAQTLTNTTTSTGVVRYTVTPIVNGCSGNSFNVDVTVNPLATGSASNQSICSGQTSSVTLTPNVSGGTFTWIAALQSGTVTGFSNQLTAVAGPIAQTLTNNTTSAGVVRYTVTPIANSCNGTTFTVDVTVNPRPAGSASNKTICSGQSTALPLNSTISGTTFTWTASLQSGTVTGFSNQSTAVSGPIAQTLSNTTTSAGIVRYTVTPGVNGCSGNTFTVDVTVQPVATGSASSSLICSESATAIALNSTPSGALYTWTVQQLSGAAITGSANQSTAVAGPIAQTLTNNTDSSGTIRYIITPIYNSCAGVSFNADVTVRAGKSNVAITGNTTICSYDSVILSVSPANPALYLPPVIFTAGPGTTNCDCPPGYIVVGMQGQVGGVFDQFSLICKKLNANGTLGSTTVVTSSNGTSFGGGPQGPYFLSTNEVMVGAQVYHDTYDIAGLTMYGKSISSIIANADNSTGTSSINMMGGFIHGSVPNQFAPNGHVITGMVAQNTFYAQGVTWKYTPINRVGELYNWSNGSTASSITVKQSGNYTLTVTDANNCQRISNPVAVTVKPVSTITPSDALPICTGSSKTLTANAGTTYLWSNGATTQSIITQGGTYTVTVDGCVSSPYTAVKKTTSGFISGKDSICPGGSNILQAYVVRTDTIYLNNSNTFNMYSNCGTTRYGYNTTAGLQWTDNIAGTVVDAQVEFLVGNSCFSSTIYPAFNSTPIAAFPVSGDCNCGPFSVNNRRSFTLPAGAYVSGTNTLSFTFSNSYFGFATDSLYNGNYARLIVKHSVPVQSYVWSTGAITNSINVTTAGTYSVTITDTDGCIYNVTKSQGNAVTPAAVISKNFTGAFCPGNQLTASNAASYLWNTGATSQGITIDTAGTYSVTVASSQGCTNTSSPENLISRIVGDTSVFGNNVWNIYAFANGGDQFNPNAWTNYRGYYTESSVSFNTQNRWCSYCRPSDASGYQGCEVGYDYHSWIAKRRNFACGYYQINIPDHDDAAQLFVNGINVWEHNGCCDAHTNVWTGFLDSTSTIEFRVTEGVGGSNASIEIIPFSLIVSTPASTIICPGNSVTLNIQNPFAGLQSMNFAWSNGDTALSTVISNAQNVSAHFSNGSGCVITSNIVPVTVNVPVASITRSFTGGICGTGQLTANLSSKYIWSTGDTVRTINITSPGIYTVTTTNQFGCTATARDTVLSGVKGDTAVFGKYVWNVYAFNSGGGSVTPQAWRDNYRGFYVDSTLNFNTLNRWPALGSPSDASGYQGCPVNVDNHSWTAKRKGFNCGIYNFGIINYDDAAQVFINGIKVFDQGCCGSNYFVWQGILDSTSTFELRVTEGGGDSRARLEFYNQQLTLTSTGTQSICTGDTINLGIGTALYNPQFGSLQWSTGSSASAIQVYDNATITAQYTSAAGCVQTSQPLTVIKNQRPLITVSDTLPICPGTAKILTSDIAAGITWNTGATTQSINVTTAGTYSVSKANCTSYTTLTQEKPVTILSNGPDSICPGYTVTLEAMRGTIDTFYISLWDMDGMYYDCVEESPTNYGWYTPGFYWYDPSSEMPNSVRVDFAVGIECGSTDSIHTTSFNWNPGPSFMRTPEYCNTCAAPTFDGYRSLNLSPANYQTSNYNYFYIDNASTFGLTNVNPLLHGYYARVIVDRRQPMSGLMWSTGDTTTAINVNAAGTYTATVPTSATCTQVIAKNIGVRPMPSPTITRSFTGAFCPPGTLTSSSQYNYQWSTGETTQAITIYSPTIYTVTVSDQLGCSASKTNTIINSIPGNPAVYGNNRWNIYSYNYGNAGIDSLTWNAGYSGYFVDSSLNFDSRNRYLPNTQSPSNATGYQGCAIGPDNHAWSAKRHGLPCGFYHIDIPNHDDASQLYINGIKVWEHNGCCDPHWNVWRGILDANSTVDFRVTEGGGGSLGIINFVLDTLRLLHTGTLNICAGQSTVITASLTDTTTSYSYQWNNLSVNDSLVANSSQLVYLQLSSPSGCTTKSDSLIVNITGPKHITTTDTAFCIGDNSTFTAYATPSSLPFDWQVRKSPSLAWMNIPVNSDTLTAGTPPTLADTGLYQVRTVTHGTGSCDSVSNTISFTVTLCDTTTSPVNARAFIESYYIGGRRMSSGLYDTGLSNDSTACDSITVELHPANSTSTKLYSVKTILHTDGMIYLRIPNVVLNEPCYIVIRHRNSMETWSKNPILPGNYGTLFDFTTP